MDRGRLVHRPGRARLPLVDDVVQARPEVSGTSARATSRSSSRPSPEGPPPLTSAPQQEAQIVECHLMAGDCDFLLRVVAADLDAYRKFQLDHLTRIRGVQSVKTEIPMQKIKLTSELPL
ncbi:Lrp/AsnC ligand binding domain-containing protein [Streptomyces sp. NPDC005970]|uniref:Lrp/AsnC ligand binding domain-containing protein n=1 Tax=Streptomyces sp. NPDC005970 TaxID=3156723 RepID=UPI0033F97F21